jgi:CheY-like chemotaxis protein
MLSPGIIGEQILSLLRRWSVETAPHDSSSVRHDDVHAVIVDSSASGGAFYETLLRNRTSWGLDNVPLITIAEMRTAERHTGVHREQVLAAPVRMQPLREALSAATGRAVPVNDPAPTSHPTFAGTRIAVLVVEDNEPNRRVIRLMLNELGIDPDEAATGHDAIGAAARRPYDVILMDLQMPDMDGLEATRRIRAQEHAHRATIVALTANVFESDEARCRAAGMDAYLQKPLRLDALSDALTAVVRPTL